MKSKFYITAAIAVLCLMGMNSCSSSEVIIETEVQAAQKQCPQDLGSGLTLTKVENDSYYVIYYYKGDENLYSFSQSLVTEDQKEQIVSTLQAQAASLPAVKKFLKALKETDKGIIYHYFTSSTSMDVIVEAKDLRY